MGHGKPHRCVRNRRTGLKTMVRERKLSCDWRARLPSMRWLLWYLQEVPQFWPRKEWRGRKEVQNIIREGTTQMGYWTDKGNAHFWGTVKMVTTFLLLVPWRGRVHWPLLNLVCLCDLLRGILWTPEPRPQGVLHFLLPHLRSALPCKQSQISLLGEERQLDLEKGRPNYSRWGPIMWMRPPGTPPAWQQRNHPMEPRANGQL